MTLFLNGGGCGEQLKETYSSFKKEVDLSRPLLYIPLAMDEERYSDCWAWIQKELENFGFPSIDMVKSAQELCCKNLMAYAAIFIGGGNTYKLLSDLRSCDAFNRLRGFVEDGGTVFGSSAGAIIFGKNIDSSGWDDQNIVELKETKGFNKVFDAYIGAHYPNSASDKTQKAKECFMNLSHEAPVIALPEEDTLIVKKNIIKIIGSEPYYIFKNGEILPMEPGQGYSPSGCGKNKGFRELLN